MTIKGENIFMAFLELLKVESMLVNGYKLPESYKIEDLRFFANILF